MVVIGAVFSGWGKHGENLQQASKLVVAMSDLLLRTKSNGLKGSTPWPQFLSEAAEEYLSSRGTHREYLESLIARGKRRHGGFLAGPSDHPGPMFGLPHVRIILLLISDVEKRVSALRLIAKTLNARPDSLLIRYRQLKKSNVMISVQESTDFDDAMFVHTQDGDTTIHIQDNKSHES